MTVKQLKEEFRKVADEIDDKAHAEWYDPFKDEVYEMCPECVQKAATDTCDAITEMLDMIPEWTPAWEELPEKGKMVLAYYDNGYENRITLAVHYENGWYDYTHYCMTQDIKWWMELPQTPEEDYA